MPTAPAAPCKKGVSTMMMMGSDGKWPQSSQFRRIYCNTSEWFWGVSVWTKVVDQPLDWHYHQAANSAKKKERKKKWFHSTIIWINSHEDGRIFFVINVLLVSLKILLTHWWSTGIPQVHSHSTGMRDQNSNTHTNTTHMHYLPHTHTHTQAHMPTHTVWWFINMFSASCLLQSFVKRTHHHGFMVRSEQTIHSFICWTIILYLHLLPTAEKNTVSFFFF